MYGKDSNPCLYCKANCFSVDQSTKPSKKSCDNSLLPLIMLPAHFHDVTYDHIW